MTNIHDICQVVLTYKGKLLLKRKDDNTTFYNKNLWSFIEHIGQDRGMPGSNSIKAVEKETGITITSVRLLSSVSDEHTKKDFYHGHLTDKQVNEIKREGQELQFFTLREVEKLSLDETSYMFFHRSKHVIEAICHNLPTLQSTV